MDRIPYAEEFLENFQDLPRHIDEFESSDIARVMVAFTIRHCEAQKEVIKLELEKSLAQFGISLTDDFQLEQTGNSLIDNAYPLENIK